MKWWGGIAMVCDTTAGGMGRGFDDMSCLADGRRGSDRGWTAVRLVAKVLSKSRFFYLACPSKDTLFYWWRV